MEPSDLRKHGIFGKGELNGMTAITWEEVTMHA